MRPRYHLPGDLAPASLAVRRAFYAHGMDYAAADRWFAGFPGERVYGLILGRRSGIYPRRFRSLKNVVLLVEDARAVKDLQPYLLRYLPEGVYYDRNAYASAEAARRRGLDYARAWRSAIFRGQELAFDLDPENLSCPIHGTVEDKMRRREGLSFCDWEYEEIRRQAAALAEDASDRWSRVRVVYSGRGFHVHVFDPEAFALSRRERRGLAAHFARRYAIDEWVTTGEMRLIRLPHSLHGMVSRIATPVTRRELRSFRYDDPRAVPPRS